MLLAEVVSFIHHNGKEPVAMIDTQVEEGIYRFIATTRQVLL